ncbi:MAG: lipid II flippase MurJ [bacterium]
MVKRLLNFFNREIGGLHDAAYFLGFFAIVSQLLALFRDRLLASMIGPGNALDIYYSSFRIPDLIYVSLASIVSVSVIVPFLAEKIEKNSGDLKKFVDNIFSFFFLAIALVSVVMFFLMPVIIPKIFFGYDQEKIRQIIEMSRIMLLSPFLLGLSNFFSSLIQVYRRFILYSLSPLIYSLGIIFGIIFLYPKFGVYGLAWGVVIGAFFHWAIQVPTVISQGLFPKIKLDLNWTEIRSMVVTAVLRTFTLGIGQIGTLFLVSMATIIGAGTVSVFSMAYNLQGVPLTVIGMSYSMAAFPTLSRLFVAGDTKKFLEEIIISARHIIFWSMPIIILFIVLRAQIVRTILGAGFFDWSATRLTAASLAVFSVSVLAQSLLLLLTRGYYAIGVTKKPLLANLAGLLLMFVFGMLGHYAFSHYQFVQNFTEALLRVADIQGTGVLMLALAYSLAMISGTAILLWWFERDFSGFWPGIKDTFFQSFSAAIIMGFVSYLGLNFFDDIFSLGSTFGVFAQGACAGILGLIVWFIILKLLKNQEINEVWRTIHHKIWKSDAIIPESNEL